MNNSSKKFKTNVIQNTSCLDGMKQIPDSTIDLIVTDPPFAIDFKAKKANYNRTSSRVLEGYEEIPKDKYYDFTQEWIRDCFRILKNSGSMYIFSGWNNLKDILIALDEIGFITVNHIIWKYQFGVVTKRKFVTSHYDIYYVTKTKKRQDKTRTFNKLINYEEDCWIINRPYRRGKKKTKTMLPEVLVRKMLLHGSNSGDLVTDFFVGSGTTPLMCKKNDRKFIGFEIDPKSYDFAIDRIKSCNKGLFQK